MILNEQKIEILKELPGYIFWKDSNSVFLGCNHAFSRALKFKHPEDIQGMVDYDLPGELKNSASHFIQQDKQVLHNQPVKTLNIHTYADKKRRVLLTEKKLIKSSELFGTIGTSLEINNSILVDILKKLYQIDKSTLGNTDIDYGSYIVNQTTYRVDLSVRESECLFYLLRGKSTKLIANYLNLSAKTIETYLERIKIKLNCRNKSELIEKGINEGYLFLIPHSLLIHQV